MIDYSTTISDKLYSKKGSLTQLQMRNLATNPVTILTADPAFYVIPFAFIFELPVNTGSLGPTLYVGGSYQQTVITGNLGGITGAGNQAGLYCFTGFALGANDLPRYPLAIPENQLLWSNINAPSWTINGNTVYNLLYYKIAINTLNLL